MKYIVDRFLSQKAKLHLEVPGEVAVVGVPEEEGQEADLGVGQEGQGVDRVVGLEVKGGAEVLAMLETWSAGDKRFETGNTSSQRHRGKHGLHPENSQPIRA